MRIRTGRNVGNPASSLNRSSRGQATLAPIPQNRGMAEIAQGAIDTLASVAVRKSLEAIHTDGHPVYCYAIRQGVKPCSCQKVEDNNNDMDLRDTNLLSPEDGIFSDKPRTTILLRDSGALDPIFDAAIDNKIEKSLDEVIEGSKNIAPSGNYPPEPDDDFSDIVSIFPSLGRGLCGICGGTGFIDSFRWVSGTRILLLPENLKSSNSITTDRPNGIIIDADESAFWDLYLPPYAIGIESVKIKDNTKHCPEIKLEVFNPSSNQFVPLTDAFYQQFSETGITTTARVSIKPDVNINSDENVVFTHAEIWLRQAELPYCQFPQIERDLSPGSIEALINTQFEIDPSIGSINRGSIIESPVHGRNWIVNNISVKKTSKGYVFNIQGSVLVMQPNDPLNGITLLNSFAGKAPSHYRGIETGAEGQGKAYSKKNGKRYTGANANNQARPYPNFSSLTNRKTDKPGK